ncbi:glycine cleavage system protein GcvH [Dethiobacter alkaliphilus]|uniref:Glycine cleavage system H protein n=1 Tax=Dethiobacter alkaliphilus AHT 1 TaxID=555088 RepID=C0GKA8_DETAL|nr:glycine cleavage system protein GcvH [Dethiobacter alkaliphilus]EEG76223.1 glycine cleavage system H protein [Dethiobacter alkaliphilus AHT 1]
MMNWEFREGLKYSKDHEWVRVDEGNLVIVGITDYAQHKLGDVVFVELPEVDDEVKAGESMGVIESVKAVADVFSAIDGVVTEVNEDLLDQPELLNQEPFEGGWIAKIELSNEGQLNELLDMEGYKEFIRQEEEG